MLSALIEEYSIKLTFLMNRGILDTDYEGHLQAAANPIHSRLKNTRASKGIFKKELGIRIALDESSASSRMNHYEKSRHVPDIQALEKSPMN